MQICMFFLSYRLYKSSILIKRKYGFTINEISSVSHRILCLKRISRNLKTLKTQFATSKRGGIRYMTFAFTEQGVV